LITGSADQSVKLWDCETGVQLHSFNFDSPARAVSFAEGDKLVVITTDPFMEQQSAIHVKNIEGDQSKRKWSSSMVFSWRKGLQFLSLVMLSCFWVFDTSL
jgi:translation initiation factor 3 subunit I